ncbi:hypothetical protein LMH87_002224 [Akanthomyces muscarius]|uniref:Uncharacterized protein n=1 Tax=Akanthomyces muscarius TaxID=2231603 RepID=A0A9W8Q8D2_AKAMU|nr:hypothetical protein LMH87_002224 [Akanthomyces muscarius]KAJ4147716.1 hypothetical protein LMH87_002224 [Akanthomyces muscarius]
MRYHPTLKGLWAFLVLSFFAILANCYRNGEQALVLRPSHRARIFNRATFDSAAIIPNDGHDSPAAYDVNPDATASSTAAYPFPTAPVGADGEPSSDTSSTVNGHSPTATTEPRSPGISSGPEIESTSIVVIQDSSNGDASPSLVTSTLDSSQDPASQTDAQGDETVTVTVTNFASSQPAHAETEYPSPSPDIKTSFTSSAAPTASDGEVSVITLTSLHTITLSIGRNSSSTKATTLRSSTSQRNFTSTVGISSSLNPTSGTTSPGPLTSSVWSIITITRTETYTGKPNTTSEAASPVTSKEAATSTIDLPTPISRIPPFSASFNLSSISGPVMSSQVSGAITSLHSNSPSEITRTVFQNITVTVGGLSETNSRETKATRTTFPTYPASSNVTRTVSSMNASSTLYPVPTLTTSLRATESTVNATAAQTPTVSTSTAVVTITVYPTPSDAMTSPNGTSVVTLHSSTTTVSSPANNASSSVFPKTGPTTSSSLSTDGSTDDIDTTCEPTGPTAQSAATTGTGAANPSGSTSTSLNGTSTYPLASTFRTTVSPISSADDGTSTYPSPSGKRLPGSPSYPWGRSGPLHRLQGPDF